ncbi:MAG: nucleoside hydrolase [Pirellulales bacterium]|nr:nucleoside hydrolase [Pirellulales bacterium]
MSFSFARLGFAGARLAAVGIVFAIAGIGGAEEECPKPVEMIFDTDIGNDVDDAMALAVIHALANRAQCELLAVTVTKDNPYAGPCVDLINTFYGRPDVPIGTVRDGMAPQDYKYIRQLATAVDNGKPRYAHDLESGADAPEAVALLRKTLAGRPDGSVVMVQVGFSTNLSRLLDSKADGASPLDGRSLVKQKVKLLSIMAGAFTQELAAKRFCEYNVTIDVPNARKVIHEWPTPVVFSGWEIGHAIQYPAASVQEDFCYVEHHPIAHAYDLYRDRKNDQPTYDLTSVLYAVRPDREYFDLSPPGHVTVEDDGFVQFKAEKNGPHRYLIATPEQVARVREALVMLTSEPPGK